MYKKYHTASIAQHFHHMNGSFLTPTGHSHQLFHVCGIIGTHFQMKAIETDMMLRRSQLLINAPDITLNNTVGAALVCVCIGLGIIYYFSLHLLYRSLPHKNSCTKRKKCTEWIINLRTLIDCCLAQVFQSYYWNVFRTILEDNVVCKHIVYWLQGFTGAIQPEMVTTVWEYAQVL